MATVPYTEPAAFRAGDLVRWTKFLSDYPANDGWTLSYTLINASIKISLTATASGAEHLVSVPAATSANYAAGAYTWMARVTKGSEVYTIGQGSLTILPNLSALMSYDGRSHAQTMVDAIEAAIQGRASALQLRMQINGRSIEYLNPTDLIKWLSYYKAQVVKDYRRPAKIGVRAIRV